MECQICHHSASGNHYGSICCRACAAFFRRTVQMKLRYRCRKNGSCLLRKETRYCCRYCRMKRCLALGMATEDDPGTSHDFYLDSSEDETPSVVGTTSESTESDFYTAKNIFGNYNFFMEEMKDRLRNILEKSPAAPKHPFKLMMCQEIAAAYAKHEEQWPNCTKEKMVLEGIVDLTDQIVDYHREFEVAASFCMEVQTFRELPLDQKAFVMKNFLVHFMQLERAYASVQLLGNDPDDRRLISLGGTVVDYRYSDFDITGVSDLDKEQLRSMFLKSDDELHRVYIRPFKRVNPDRFELMYLIASGMWNLQGKPGITEDTLKVSRKIKTRLAEELNFHYSVEQNIENYASRIYKLQSLITALDRIDELREQDSSMSRTFNVFKIDIHLHELTS